MAALPIGAGLLSRYNMKRTAKNITETIGSTPLIEISERLGAGHAKILAKLESFNPGGSAKDRIALSMIERAERDGILKPGATIIEPTSGNTGVGLALVSAVRGYRLILVMPETMSVERRKLAAAYGAEIILTPGSLGMKGSIEKAEALRETIPSAVILQQFENPANPKAHYETTGPEIWRDTDANVDILIATVGTGGTLTGTGKFLKEKNPDIKIIAVEPDSSAVLSGGQPGPHKLQGIGAGFIPATLDTSVIDEVITVSAENAGAAARAAASRDGLLVGISSGAALWAALEVSNRAQNEGKTIVVILSDTGERYLSTWLFDD